MIHHVVGIDAELQTLRFRQTQRFAQIRIDARKYRSSDDKLPEPPSRAGSRILKNNLAGLRVLDCLKRAQAGKARGHICALRILDGHVSVWIEVTSIDLSGRSRHGSPFDSRRLQIEWSNNVRSSIGVKHVYTAGRRVCRTCRCASGKTQRHPAADVGDPAHLPTFDNAAED